MRKRLRLATSVLVLHLLAGAGCSTGPAPQPDTRPSGPAQGGVEPTCPAGPTPTPISQVQGVGPQSPLEGKPVVVEGVVAGDFQSTTDGLSGFFIQDRGGDGDPATSEGLFIYVPAENPLSSVDVRPGDLVRVAGTVKEFSAAGGTLTEIDAATEVTVCASGLSVAPTPLPLPVAEATDHERFEGMLVTLPETLTVTDTSGLGRFGEIVVSSGGRLFHQVAGAQPAGARDDEGKAFRRLIVDDGSTRRNPSPIPYLSGAGADATRRVGDTARGVTGVLSFGFGAYRLQPTIAPAFVSENPRTAEPRPVGGDLRVASFNVLNFFTTLGARGASDAAELSRQRAKIVAALKAIDADVVGLIEIENNGQAAVGELLRALNAAYAGAGSAEAYAAVPDPPTGTGSDEIKVALLYKPQRVRPAGASLSDPAPIFERPPLAQTFRLGADGSGGAFTVVVSHLKSKGSCPETGDVDRGQGCWNVRRTEQARRLLDFVRDLQARSADPDVLVLGDLNAYGEEDPIRVLTTGRLVNLSLRVPAPERYTYVFDGQSGYLDHALATPSLSGQVSGVTQWHINADEPQVLDYNLEGKPDDRYAPTPYRSSDHDPVIVGLRALR